VDFIWYKNSWDEYIRWIWIPQETFEVKRLGAKSKSHKIWGRKRKQKAGMREPREIKQTFFHIYDAMKSMQSNWPPTFRWRERERETIQGIISSIYHLKAYETHLYVSHRGLTIFLNVFEFFLFFIISWINIKNKFYKIKILF
jgi:hypothetical protein